MTPLTNPITFSTTQKTLSKFPSDKPTTQAQAQAQTQWPEMLTATEFSNHQGRLPEPSQNEQATPRVLTILSAVLEKLVARNDRLADGLTPLNGHVSSSGGGTAARLGKNRLSHRHPDSLVVSLNVHRHYNNAFYARVGGVSNAELNKLELEVLFLLDFGVTVSSRVFESYCLHLEKEMLVNGTAQKIERALISNLVNDVTEISVENTESCSPCPQSTGLI
ncbi:hypothetical protein JRO89_XS01G0146000 [Xanthoceras sorbifolium]|uniref:Cyclin n=1 Tax=Xanthoceras sorbifolium TaxID=99658 RepID=A0ABQ8IJL0_9ROSI|nr:hypothetical protein JRO89_XS01G0146000 [Xanthoceras sorbifolium]